jgi:excinuclease ABC subunit B
MAYNKEHHITPTTVSRTREEILNQKSILDIRGVKKPVPYIEQEERSGIAADPIIGYMTKDQISKLIQDTEVKMKKAAKDLDFITAAQLRDELQDLKKKL